MPTTPAASASASGSHPSPRPSAPHWKRKISKLTPQPTLTPNPDPAISALFTNKVQIPTTSRPSTDFHPTTFKPANHTKPHRPRRQRTNKQAVPPTITPSESVVKDPERIKLLKAERKKAKRRKRLQARKLAQLAQTATAMNPIVIESTSDEILPDEIQPHKSQSHKSQPDKIHPHQIRPEKVQPHKIQPEASEPKRSMVVDESALSLNQSGSVQRVDQQQEFVKNLDFIAFGDSEDGRPGSSNKRSKGATQDPKSRGTKRKFTSGPGVTEEEADAVRKRKGLIITPWFDRLDWKGRNVQQMLTAEIGSFVAYIKPTAEEDQLRQMIIELIRKAVQSRWPDADVEPFGSFGTKLYLPGGDIDLVVLSARMMSEHKSKILYKLAPIIREQNIGQEVVVIAKAKVPIIKFKTIFGNFNVDISINQSNGLMAMRKVNELLDDIKYLSIDMRPNRRSREYHEQYRSLDDKCDSEEERAIRKVVDDLGAAKCLILVIKSVLKQRGMNEVYTGGLGSYSIICLVISFLQLHPKIQRGDIDPNKNLGVLLLEFFELYGKHYNFDHTGISVRKGGYYFSKAQRGWCREKQPHLLSIEDPADETNDISGGSHNILGVRSVFSGAFDLLSATLYHRHSLQTSRAAASHSSSSSARPLLSVPVPQQQDEGAEVPRDPMAQSLLGEIMGVTKELVEQRKKNLKLFFGGTLQRLLNLPMPVEQEEAERGKSKKNAGGDGRGGAGGSSRSKKTDDVRSGAREGENREADPEPARSREHERDGKEARKRDLGRRNSERELQADSQPGREPSRQRLRYDDLDDEPTKPGSRASRKGKGKARNQDPAPLWIEDVVPSEVACLKSAHMAKAGTGLAGNTEDEPGRYRNGSATKPGLQDGPDQSGHSDHLDFSLVLVDLPSGGCSQQGESKTVRNEANERDGSSSPEMRKRRNKRESVNGVDEDELDSRYSSITAGQRTKKRQAERLLAHHSGSEDSMSGLFSEAVGRAAGGWEEYFVDDEESEDGEESATMVEAALVPARDAGGGDGARAESPSPGLVKGLRERAKRREYRLHLMGHRPRAAQNGRAKTCAAADLEQGGHSSPGTPPGTPPDDDDAATGWTAAGGASPGTPPGSPPVSTTLKVSQMDRQALWLSKAGPKDEQVLEDGSGS